jgi:V8-like Glu-specific endopeptidase
MWTRSLLTLIVVGMQSAYAQPSANDKHRELTAITDSLKQEGIAFDPISKTTWSLLSETQQDQTIVAIKTIQTSTKLSATEKKYALNEFAAKADLAAASALTQSNRYPSIQIPRELQVLSRSPNWLTSPKNPQEAPFSVPFAAAIATYRARLQDAVPHWQLRLEQLISPSTKKNPTPYIVYPNTPLPILPGLESPVPSPRGQIHAVLAQECLKLESTDKQECKIGAFQLNKAAATIGPAIEIDRRMDPFNPLGFLEVVKIEHQWAALNCTGTLIDADLILTAKHCVQDSQAQHLRIKIPQVSHDALKNCQEALQQERKYLPCMEFTTHSLAAEKAIRSHATADIALLKLARPSASTQIARVTLENLEPQQISIAGYGENGDGKTPEQQEAIEVGWYEGQIAFQSDTIAWRFNPATGAAATCDGDSGGPIFLGRQSGYVADPRPRQIIAITTAADRAECKEHWVMQTRLSSPTVKSWLCAQPDFPNPSGSPNGCTAPANTVAKNTPKP